MSAIYHTHQNQVSLSKQWHEDGKSGQAAVISKVVAAAVFDLAVVGAVGLAIAGLEKLIELQIQSKILENLV